MNEWWRIQEKSVANSHEKNQTHNILSVSRSQWFWNMRSVPAGKVDRVQLTGTDLARCRIDEI